MTNISTPCASDVARICLEKYLSLPKTGKPKSSEWTVLSCIIQFDRYTNESKVVSLGTGTKCVGSDQLCPQGLILNDSHAEVISRRAFLRYLYEKIANNDGIFQYNDDTRRFTLKENFSFHFISTYPPCGDASIVGNSTTDIQIKDDNAPPEKRIKMNPTTSEIFTGARLISSNKSDLMEQDEGAVRIKPGRGVRTLSMSCSDKISRWNVLGLQGALFDLILEKPLYLESYTFFKNANIHSISRAFFKRWSDKPFRNDRFHIYKPEIRICLEKLSSDFIPSDDKKPCPTSIAWCDVKEKSLEISVFGKRQGIIKKNWNKKVSSLQISRALLFQQFKTFIQSNESILNRLGITAEELKSKTYEEAKSLSVEYQTAWNIFKTNVIGVWTTKPKNLNQFI